MGFKEVASLNAEMTIAIGKKDANGRPYPTQAEGYYLGKRQVENKRGTSNLYFLQTAKGNLGVWGTTDLDRKLAAVNPGTMVRITAAGTKPTPNGDMYIYKVEEDADNTIDVSTAGESEGGQEGSEESDEGDYNYAALANQSNKARVEELLKSRSKKN